VTVRRNVGSLTSRILKVCFDVGDFSHQQSLNLWYVAAKGLSCKCLNTKGHETVLYLFHSLDKRLGSREQ
jgi:hypothetical protein